MAFGQSSGPPATGKQMRELLELLVAAGHRDFRDARGPMGFTQRQAGGKFTRDEADAFIEQLETAAHDGAPMAATGPGGGGQACEASEGDGRTGRGGHEGRPGRRARRGIGSGTAAPWLDRRRTMSARSSAVGPPLVTSHQQHRSPDGVEPLRTGTSRA